jgi:hypothetical protein
MALLLVGLAVTTEASAGDAAESGRSWPKDTTSYARPALHEDFLFGRIHDELGAAGQAFMVDVVVNNTNAGLAASDTFNDGETSIAVNPSNPNEIAITAFSSRWGIGNAALWHSTDAGQTWTKRLTVPAPPGAPNTANCPCDQAVDYGRGNRLSGAFMTESASDVADLYSGTTVDPTNAASWGWLLDGSGNAVKTETHGVGDIDQPWLLVGPDPVTAAQDNVYVAYDDFSVSPRDMRVAVARGSNPPQFTVDRSAGTGPTGTINPGFRLAVDSGRGFVYAAFQQLLGAGAGDSRKINYMLNRSVDGGNTWGLNGNASGLLIATADSNQPTPKFGTVNALLGGVDHAAVDPNSGDVYYVYGTRDSGTAKNRLSVVRLRSDGAGGLVKGVPVFVTDQVQAAIPSVAVTSDGTVGVFYYTSDGMSSDGFPIFTAHVTFSRDHGQSFVDNPLLTFLSSAKDNGDPRQRVLGDYMQLKAVGCTFYGAFTGNGVPFGRTFANHDPIFFRVPACNALVAEATVNQPTFAPGQTLSVTAGLTNPALQGAADVYAALLRPDGIVQFFTGSAIVNGNVSDLTTFRPIAAGVPLTAPFSVTVPNFYSHQWVVGDPHGTWTFFVAAVKAGALSGGTLPADALLGLAFTSFSFP